MTGSGSALGRIARRPRYRQPLPRGNPTKIRAIILAASGGVKERRALGVQVLGVQVFGRSGVGRWAFGVEWEVHVGRTGEERVEEQAWARLTWAAVAAAALAMAALLSSVQRNEGVLRVPAAEFTGILFILRLVVVLGVRQRARWGLWLGGVLAGATLLCIPATIGGAYVVTKNWPDTTLTLGIAILQWLVNGLFLVLLLYLRRAERSG